ncbi:MAG: hypothetical protein E6H81_00825 [Chloroflexi bacterium]|nr:MAG: hypothetical protein E6H81_00825 [Chloroflexota bacterium]
MNVRLLAFALLAALLGALTVGGTSVAAHGRGGGSQLPAIPVSGAFTDSDGPGSFSGTLDIERFIARDGRLFAIGTIDGTLTNALGTSRSVTDVAVTLPVTNVSVAGSRGPAADAPVAAQQPAQDCQILHLEFGGVTLDVLGIMLQLSPITLDLNLGGVLGGILCGLLGALAGGAPAQAQAGILNAALGSAP